MPAPERIRSIADEDTFEEWDRGIENTNPIGYKGYPEKVEALKQTTGLDEAVVTGKVAINGIETALGVCDGRFLMASMGEVVGEKITRMVERATEEKLPVIIFTCSGGARMQEGIVSLIGFAGPRVIEQTIGQKLPKGFQRSEFLKEHGFVDQIVERQKMRQTLGKILKMHQTGNEKVEKATKEFQNRKTRSKTLEAWDRVQISRRNDRPVAGHYIQALFQDFVELHGDRYFADDPAIVGGIATFHGRAVTVIAQAKGQNTKENIGHNFGMPSPEGYRKALRLMKQAEKFHRPVICFVDTPGAFCGISAEERGQGEAIARNLYEMSALKTPILSIVIGEGGSGGALAMAVSDQVWMLENSIYSILSPEGFASILWKDSTKAAQAAKVMRLTAADLKEMGIVEKVFAEPEHFTAETMSNIADELEKNIEGYLEEYTNKDIQELVDSRYERFRRM